MGSKISDPIFFFKLGALQCIITFENMEAFLNIYHRQFFKTFSPLSPCVCVKILRPCLVVFFFFFFSITHHSSLKNT